MKAAIMDAPQQMRVGEWQTPEPKAGEVTAVVSPSGAGVIFDGRAPAGQLQFENDEIDEMIERAEIA